MKSSNSLLTNSLALNTLRASRAHFVYAGILALQVIIYDAWDLVTPERVLQRWIFTAILLLTTTVVWYIAKVSSRSSWTYKTLLFALISADIAVATFSVYTQRGMASRAVILYLIPLIVAALTYSRAAIFATAALCVAAYTTAAITYFTVFFNEGYKIELYGEVGFYSTIIFLTSALLWIVVSNHKFKSS